MLSSWSEKIRDQFEKLATAYSFENNYAVFDADGTLWSNDLNEALLAQLESEKIVSAGRYNEAMFPLPIMAGESLVSYYLRLCDADISLGYFWLCQAFAGFSTGELKEQIDDLFIKKGTIPYIALQSDGSMLEKQIERPSIFTWQQELRAFLFDKGINVFVVTASQEELVRMVVADPKYGLDIPSSSVIGARLALRSSNGKNF
jgi:phosphorylcholine phosphatase